MTFAEDREMQEAGFPGVLRGVALAVVLTGAGGSLGLMLYAGRHQKSLILMVLFTGWVLSPYLAAVLAHVASKSWSIPTRATLYFAMLVLTLGALVIYGNTAFGHTTAKVGFIFLVVPLASWLLMAVTVPIAALISGRRSRRVARPLP